MHKVAVGGCAAWGQSQKAVLTFFVSTEIVILVNMTPPISVSFVTASADFELADRPPCDGIVANGREQPQNVDKSVLRVERDLAHGLEVHVERGRRGRQQRGDARI